MTLFTYLGKEGAILRMVEAFLNHPSRFMHPVELARATGLGVFEIRDRLEGCQALFVRLPRTPDGLVRYALASSSRGSTRKAFKPSSPSARERNGLPSPQVS